MAEGLITTQLADTLLLTPLFQGLSEADLHTIVGRAHFLFTRAEAGKTIIRRDNYSHSLMILLNGRLEVRSSTADHLLTTTEQIKAPAIIEPDRLFGMHQRYFSDYKAVDTCSFLSIQKQEIVQLLSNYEVCRINFINYHSNQLQKLFRQQWQAPATTLPDRIMQLLKSHCLFPQGKKVFKVKMQTIANILGCSRLAVSKALNQMQAEGKLKLSRGEIIIS